jgi:DNA mismatch repair protein MLH3
VRRPSPATTEKPLFDRSGILLRKPFDDVDEREATPKPDAARNEPLGAGLSLETGSERETVVWVDSNTKIKSLIDARTGFAVKQRNNAEHKLLPRLPRQRSPSGAPRTRESKPAAIGQKNTVFQATEPRIAQVLQESEIACCGHGEKNREFQKLGNLADPAGGNIRATLEARISKSSLQKAEVVAQVDQKFILTKVDTNFPSSPTSARNHGTKPDRLLILIDQHAADERCRVEALLRAYFVPDPESSSQLIAQTQSPDKPLRFDLSRQDGELLVRFQSHFAHWGIAYEVFRGDEAPSQKGVTVEVQLLPPSILERCRLEPRLLVDLLRKEIWKLDSMGSRGTGGLLRAGADSDWVARFHDCPEGILDLINSRACRSKYLTHLWMQERMTDSG